MNKYIYLFSALAHMDEPTSDSSSVGSVSDTGGSSGGDSNGDVG